MFCFVHGIALHSNKMLGIYVRMSGMYESKVGAGMDGLGVWESGESGK